MATEPLKSTSPSTEQEELVETAIKLNNVVEEKEEIKSDKKESQKTITELPDISQLDDKMFREENSRAEIGAMTWIFRITDIDLVKETFFADFGAEFYWRATKSDYLSYKSDPENYIPSYCPQITFMNGDMESHELQKGDGSSGYKIVMEGQKGTFGETYPDKIRYPIFNVCFYTFSGTFTEKLELENFPFDVQDLQITMRLTDDVSKAVFVPSFLQFKGDINLGYLELNYSALQEYTVHKPFIEYGLLKYYVTQPSLNIRLKIERNYGMYFWTIYLMAFVSTAATLFAFSMDPVNDLSDRFGHVVTLILTAVAFQFVVSTELPKLPYLTLLDEYIIMSFIFLFIVMMLVAIIPMTGDRYDDFDPGDPDNIINKTDKWALYVAIMILVIYHLVAITRAMMMRKKEMMKIGFDKWEEELYEKKNKKPGDEDKKEVDRINFSCSRNARIDPEIWKDIIDPDNYKDCPRIKYE